jgi:O-antigen ligase
LIWTRRPSRPNELLPYSLVAYLALQARIWDWRASSRALTILEDSKNANVVMKSFVARLLEWTNLLLFVWSGAREPRARRIRIDLIDYFNLALALVFPWSTTGTSVFIFPIVAMMLITHGPREMIDQLKNPACALPIALVGLALVGTTWAVGVPSEDRLHAISKVLKLLCFVPFFLHFQKTRRATSIFAAYIASNCLLLVLSYLVFFSPTIGSIVGTRQSGVPFKNYIDQSQAFALIGVVFLAFAAESLRDGTRGLTICFFAISTAFLANLAFVNVARTAFFYLPVMLGIFLLRFARRWLSFGLIAGCCVLATGLWAVSPNLQSKMTRLLHEVDAFRANATTIDGYEAGGAERLEFWRKAIGFVQSAPVFGHGTGSTRYLFAAEAAGKTGLMAKVVENPHNQTLAVAVQWGLVGCVLLYAMWCAHLLLFRDGLSDRRNHLLSWIGLLVVVQNLTSSLLNSHLFDFYQGWLYVLMVAIIGGQLRRQNIEVAPRSALGNSRCDAPGCRITSI